MSQKIKTSVEIDGSLTTGEYGVSTGHIKLDTTPTNTPTTPGSMYWNDIDGTVDIKLKGGNVSLQVGQENVKRIVNKSGIDLLEANYQVVRTRSVSEGGAVGQRLSVVLAQANNDANSAATIGVVTETILNNQEGFINISGEVHEINTTGSLQGETWVDGDLLYLSPTVAGKLTNIKPVAPQHLVAIAQVVYAHAIHGKIDVHIQNGYELDELHNVSAVTPNNNEVLTYETSSLLWKPKTISTILGYTPASDDNVVHLTGTETITGAKTFNSLSVNTNGQSALFSTYYGLGSSGENIFIGGGTASASSIGSQGSVNTSLGINSLSSNTFGEYNSALGAYSLRANTTGTANVSVGTESMYSNTTGNNNSAVGLGALYFNTTGQYNSAIGSDAGTYINSGGSNALSSYSVYLGQDTRASASGNTNEIVIGSGARGNGSNSVTLGNTSISKTILQGNTLIGTTTDAGYKLDVNGTGRFSGSVAGNSFIKSGGTATQILAANGSVITAGTGITISGGVISSTASGGVTSFNTRTGAVTLSSGDVTGALGYTPISAEADTLATVTARGASTGTNITISNTAPSLTFTATGLNRSATIGITDGANMYISAASNGNLYLGSGTTTFINSQVALHAGNYNSYSPTLTGTGASGTWGISITGNAGTAANLNGSINASASGISSMKVNDTRYWVNDPNAPGSYFQALTMGNGSDFTQIGVNSSNQMYFRFNGSGSTWYNVLSSNNYNSYVPTLTGGGASGTWGISITGNAATATSATSAGSTTYLAALGNYVWSASTLPTGFNQGIQSSFVSSSQGFQSYGSVMTMNTYSSGGGALQLYVPYSPTYGGSALQVRFGNYDVSSGNSWTSWKTILQSDNYNSYAPTLTGGGASGTWGISVTGNANTATTLQTARTINGVSFNGSANISISRINDAGGSGNYLSYSSGNELETYNSSGALIDMYLNYSGGANSVLGPSGNIMLHAGNYNNYAPTKTGTGASGTWGINITGNASSVNTVQGGTNADYYLTFADSNNGSPAGEFLYTGAGIKANPATGTITATTVQATADIVAYYSSDSRFKDNITPISNALDKVKQIGGYEFDWNDNQTTHKGHDIGVIAQEIETIFPEIVANREDGYKSVKYERLIPILIEAIKEQQKQIEELKQLVKQLTQK